MGVELPRLPPRQDRGRQVGGVPAVAQVGGWLVPRWVNPSPGGWWWVGGGGLAIPSLETWVTCLPHPSLNKLMTLLTCLCPNFPTFYCDHWVVSGDIVNCEPPPTSKNDIVDDIDPIVWVFFHCVGEWTCTGMDGVMSDPGRQLNRWPGTGERVGTCVEQAPNCE